MQRETHVLVENATVSSLTGAFFPEFGSVFSLLTLLKCRLLVGDALIMRLYVMVKLLQMSCRGKRMFW